MKEYFVLDDFDFKNKTVAIRIDLNSDFENGKLLPNERFEAYSKTIKELIEREAKIIILAHQSRKGEPDFTSLEQHSKLFSKYVGYEIKFVNDIIGEKAKNEILNLKSGEALMLDNVRFLDDEDVEADYEKHKNSKIVKFLSQFIDYYILDAFSVSHRKHASIIGFTYVKPMIAGRVMEKEIESVKEAIKPLGINLWIVGGAKIDDVIKVLEKMFSSKPESIEKVLTGGLLANLFLLAQGYEIGKRSLEVLESKKYLNLLEKAKNLLANYYKEIELPIDVAIEENGERKEVNVTEIPKNALILDIGSKTIEKYKRFIREARSILVKGPLGKFEQEGFEIGTKEILEEVAKSDAYSLIGGGDTSVAIEKLNIDKSKFNYISVGGGALISYLSEGTLPGIEALKINYKLFKK